MSNRIFLGMPPPNIENWIKTKWTPQLPFSDCLCFTCESETGSVAFKFEGYDENWNYGTLPCDKSFQCSVDDQKTWQPWDGHIINLTKDQKVYIRALNDNDGIGDVNQMVSRYFVMEGEIAGSGNIQYLLTANGSRMDVPQYCYYGMFSGCSSLTQAPELPATTLAYYCYSNMFSGCSSLTQAPELPATTLASDCYFSMFGACSSLTQAPELPATTLANYCYSNMFNGCSSLTQTPELPATTLANSCYSSMFSRCTSLTQAPNLPATTLANYCYSNMFQGCTGLTQAPELPATTLASSCYYYMFSGCSSMSKDIHMKSTINGTYLTSSHGTLINGQNIIYDL